MGEIKQMNTFETLLKSLSMVIWGPVSLVFLLGIGGFLLMGLRGFPWFYTPNAFHLLWKGRYSTQPGDISPFQALMTSLSATIGTGNIAGVATAIALGGPGAVFWMWITALVGMATKYAEAVLAVKYREKDALGCYVGGPMYYIKNGLGQGWRGLGVLFALFGGFAAFGIGNMVQANSIADALDSQFQIAHWQTALVITLLTAAVILGGIKRIAKVTSDLVPVMAISYIVCALFILVTHWQQIPAALGLIIRSAFSETAATGGFSGATIWLAVRFGVARGVFSNEAGLGSAPIAHAAAMTEQPVQQGMIAMLGTLIDTLIICTLTALVIIVTGAWQSGETGVSLSALAYNTALPHWGGMIVALGLVVFAFTTILGWSYYGERCAEFLFGIKIIGFYRLLWLLAIPLGALGQLEIIWLLADIMNGLMALPNLLALAVLSPVVFKLTSQYKRSSYQLNNE